jgi:glycosyltransferase involved in cell wall biosynthesis
LDGNGCAEDAGDMVMNRGRHFLHIFPGFGIGGMELRSTRIINGMGPGVRHTIVALMGTYEAREFIDPHIRVECPPPPPRTSLFSYVRELRKLIRKHDPDVLLTYNWGAIDAVLGAWTVNFRPLVHHECGFGSEESVNLKARRVWARRILLRRASAVAVTSRTLREISVRQYKLPPEKVRWIRTGVDVQRFRPGLSTKWRCEAGIQDDELLFGFVGGLRPEKNLGFLLRAFAAARIPRARLVLVGDGAERSRLEQAARDHGIADRVLFPGRVSAPEEYLAALDIFLLSSSTEQTSNAMLEAMACGLPAVSTDVGDGRELLGDTGAPAVIPPGDLGAYSDALVALAGSPELRARLGAANRQRCVNQYSLESMVRGYEALYETACNGTL